MIAAVWLFHIVYLLYKNIEYLGFSDLNKMRHNFAHNFGKNVFGTPCYVIQSVRLSKTDSGVSFPVMFHTRDYNCHCKYEALAYLIYQTFDCRFIRY